MPKRWTHTAAFKEFGTTPVNTRWSWSARSPDGRTVVATLWQDQFRRENGRVVYSRPAQPPEMQENRLGFRELMENFAWARDHCEGRFNVIIAKAVDPTADPRSIHESYPSKMIMRLTHLDVTTGAWAAEAEGL